MKKLGLQPIPMMDRDKWDEVPQGQVGTPAGPFWVKSDSVRAGIGSCITLSSVWAWAAGHFRSGDTYRNSSDWPFGVWELGQGQLCAVGNRPLPADAPLVSSCASAECTPQEVGCVPRLVAEAERPGRNSVCRTGNHPTPDV